MSENEKYISRSDEMGNIHISVEVLNVIAAAAALEVEGVGGLSANGGTDMAELVGRKGVTKGVRLTMTDEVFNIDISILVKYGYVVSDVAVAVQESVMSAVENTSGLKVTSVNVTVGGVMFPRGNQNS